MSRMLAPWLGETPSRKPFSLWEPEPEEPPKDSYLDCRFLHGLEDGPEPWPDAWENFSLQPFHVHLPIVDLRRTPSGGAVTPHGPSPRTRGVLKLLDGSEVWL